MTYMEFVARLMIAVLLGAVIGFERQYRQRSAGLRTNTLVSTGAAIFVLLSAALTSSTETADPSRVAGQIVTGIGFLGAGVIMKDGFNVKGLNTAATIWCSAAVGSLAGAGLIFESMISATAIVGTHLMLRPLGRKLESRPFSYDEQVSTRYMFEVRCKAEVENHIRVLMMQFINQNEDLQLRTLKSLDDESPTKAAIQAEIVATSNKDQEMEKAAGRLTILHGVTYVSWEIMERQSD
ncbi:MgtC/SapB family protein [Natronoflexus pectinivorans]|uniref:Protein MgtC n=1 Tax=Natronoflexus pectinivorans TaxID=682526 RepID=A0A4V2RW66_9BACT|nr:MgtC/SapB family protein [Natronoflexus pectinivorans]TCO07059.1 putative Mg2+ transporter-C (MgtC) family protein [Natronoflexus pectinivorans]